jgi:molecular chaperone DnaJ
MFGNMMTASTCARCGGSGQEIVDPCRACGGRGRVPLTQTLTVHIPPGVDDGAQLRVSGHGEAGVRGGGKGDLYVAIHVAEHSVFKRANEDLACEVVVSMTVAALGGRIEIPTLEGPETYEIDPGTQSGEIIRLRNRGMPRLNGRGRGTLIALLKVQTPTDLSEEEARLLARLAELRGEETGGRHGLFDRFKEAFK